MPIDETSLSGTIDAVDARLVEQEALPEEQRDRVVTFLLGRQVRWGRELGTFAPFPSEFEQGVRLFSGERLRTRLATLNVLSLESARILALLAGERTDVRNALAQTSIALGHTCFAVSHCVVGECAHSSIAYMRDAASDRSGRRRNWIERHLRVLGAQRDGTGRWRRFPFYYTLLALLDVGTPSAYAELEYARPACLRVIGRASDSPYADRRRRVVERTLRLADGSARWP